MKQAFFRLIRHDQSLFIEPMKRWFQSFGYDIAIGLTSSAGGNQRPSASKSTNVAGPPKEVVGRGATPKQTPAQVAPDEGQLDPDLVRDVFTRAKIPADNATPPESESPLANRAVVPDQEEAAAEEDSSPKAAALLADRANEDSSDAQTAKADSMQPPQVSPRSSPTTGASTARDVAAQATAAPKATQEAPPTPLVRTMVETVANRAHGVQQELGLLPDGLEELFLRNARVNVGVKTLLLNVDPVDVRELTEELNEFARTIGAIDRPVPTETAMDASQNGHRAQSAEADQALRRHLGDGHNVGQI